MTFWQFKTFSRLFHTTSRTFNAMSPTTADIQSKFLSSPFYAVIGASKDTTKYGTKVLKWYQAREYTVTPVHPKESELEGVAALKSLADLPSPKETSVSIVTPPKVTLGALQLAKELDIPALWLQPGAEDEAVLEYVKEHLSDRVIYGGPCILVEGDGIARSLKSSL